MSSRAHAQGRVAADLGVAATQQFELQSVERWGERLDVTTPIEAGDVLIYAATDAGVVALWGSPRFGLAPQRLYEVSVSSGGSGTLRDLEDEGGLRVVAARTTKPLSESPRPARRHLLRDRPFAPGAARTRRRGAVAGRGGARSAAAQHVDRPVDSRRGHRRGVVRHWGRSR